MEYKDSLKEVYETVLNEELKGTPASYIPELSKVDPNKLGVSVMLKNGHQMSHGDCSEKFSIQSIVKVLTLSYLYQYYDEEIWERVGVEPSGTPFNSLLQLEADNGIPRNPFINAGAIVICDMMLSCKGDIATDFLNFVRKLAKSPGLEYSKSIAKSEKEVGFRNIALCNFLKALGNINNKPEDVLDLYFTVCSLEMTCKELCQSFMFLTNDDYKSHYPDLKISESQTKRINAIMLTCGFYDESGEFSFKVGLPGKSGVGGGIVAVHPNNYCITVWSPPLNKKGNSYRGMRLLELFTTKIETSIF